MVVIGRVLQGFGGGIFPLCFGIIRDEFPREKVAGSIGLISAIFGIGGGAGLIGGGLIVDHASYHWIFWLGAISAGARRARHPAAGAGVARAHAGPGRPARRRAARRRPRAAADRDLAGERVGLGQRAGRSALIAAGLVVLAIWVGVERRTEQPLADIPTLIKPPVLMTNIATLLVGFGMFGSFLLIPQLAELPEWTGFGFGLDATGAGPADAARAR